MTAAGQAETAQGLSFVVAFAWTWTLAVDG